MRTPVVMRSNNDMPIILDTLRGLSEQDLPFELIAFDNASEDGTREALARYTSRIVDVPKGTYNPGRVLNQAMGATDADIVVFLNSDCIPQNRNWLRTLLDAFENPSVAAAFGRQIPRDDCLPLFAKDTNDTFGDGARQLDWRHCFSMASSAIRRSVWEGQPFNENIQYSEDIDWTWRARCSGWEIRYVAESVVMHSHNYTLQQYFRRQRGEGMAEAFIFDWTDWQRSLLRYSVLPFVRQVIDDCRFCLQEGHLGSLAHSIPLRMAQSLGRRQGFQTAWKERSQK